MAPLSACTACYLAETFAPRGETGDAERVRAAAEALEASGVHIRYLHSLFVPADETAFHVLEAQSCEAVEQALRAAGLEADRISPAIAAEGTERFGRERQAGEPTSSPA